MLGLALTAILLPHLIVLCRADSLVGLYVHNRAFRPPELHLFRFHYTFRNSPYM